MKVDKARIQEIIQDCSPNNQISGVNSSQAQTTQESCQDSVTVNKEGKLFANLTKAGVKQHGIFSAGSNKSSNVSFDPDAPMSELWDNSNNADLFASVGNHFFEAGPTREADLSVDDKKPEDVAGLGNLLGEFIKKA
ncbi:hypothetical protein BVY03_03895 [bacterium K02(2017)]|nr:hypothetical protein BVY03_03895 [bacterium K02(2017)]